MEKVGTYISVILPLRLEWNPCYFVPEGEGPVARGDRVSVRFAGRKYTGVVRATGIVPGIDESRILEILDIVRDMAPVTGDELRLWEFVSE